MTKKCDVINFTGIGRSGGLKKLKKTSKPCKALSSSKKNIIYDFHRIFKTYSRKFTVQYFKIILKIIIKSLQLLKGKVLNNVKFF